MDPAKKLASHILSARLDRIPKKAIERAKLSILDTIATAIGGSDDHISHAVRRFGQYSQGKPECRVWVTGEKLPAGLASLVNAVVARALDFDETYELCVNGCHASAYDVPPAIALAERDPTITGAEFLTAVIAGIDIHVRLALSVLSNAVDTGRDNMIASFGTTAVAARLLRLNEKQILDAFGIAYAQAAGEFQMYEETSHTVALQQGLRARTGVDSAMFVLAGLNGPNEPFLGKYGFYKAFEPEYDLKLLLDGLGEDYINANISFKPWPCCKATHPGIFGMLTLREKEKFTADDVVGIEAGVNHLAEGLVVQPHKVKWNPQDPVDGRFSLPYTLAVAAAKGKVGITDFRKPAFQDPTVRRILAATKVTVDAEIDRTHGLHQNSPTKLTVKLKGGGERSIRIDKPFGHPENPADFKAGETKLRQCAEVSLVPFTEAQLQAICDGVRNLEKLPNLSSLLDVMVSSGKGAARAAGE
ncbi:MAG: MmgE/PrpD family protein [Rhodospirillales bacterium]|nr:MmgE/PrpD family protein [Rhodospirillales bacterium]